MRRHGLTSGALALALILATAGPATLADSLSGKKARAVELYAAGNFPEAGKLLAEIDQAGAADGSLLYRLSYCQRTAGDQEAGLETQTRARTALEAEFPSSNNLEVPFYLVNTYQNMGLDADVARVAAKTTARLESGDIATPGSSLDMFRLGKLYADQNLTDKAIDWYVRSLELATGDGAGASYVRWASRYVAERGFDRRDYVTAARYFTLLTEAGDGTVADFDRLGLSNARVGKFAEAAAAWKRVEQLNPADADRARYCGRLSSMVAKLRNIPRESREGTPWADVSKEGLEAVMRDEAEGFRQLLAEVESIEEPTDDERGELRRRVNEVKGHFVMAGLEYAIRNLPIRETAFFGGYAPLILRPSAWRPKMGGPKMKKAAPKTEE